MENLKIERTEGRLSPRYRVIIADMDKGEVVLDARAYGLMGALVESVETAPGFEVYEIEFCGRCPARAYPTAARAMKASARKIKRIWKEARR